MLPEMAGAAAVVSLEARDSLFSPAARTITVASSVPHGACVQASQLQEVSEKISCFPEALQKPVRERFSSLPEAVICSPCQKQRRVSATPIHTYGRWRTGDKRTQMPSR